MRYWATDRAMFSSSSLFSLFLSLQPCYNPIENQFQPPRIF
jgi:hypothetical protein